MFRVLIVDDDARFRRVLRLVLTSHGYEVAEVTDGPAAVASIAAAPAPDLVVLDWHMPLMNGPQTCRALHVQSSVPVIMTSANRSNSRQAALEAGAIDYIPKPFAVDDLLERIESVLRR